MTKANDQRVKMSLERARLALKVEQKDLEKRRRDYLGERDDALAVLRILCGLYGDNDWPDAAPLPEILEAHLAVPLARQMTEVRAYVGGVQGDLARAQKALLDATTAPPPPPEPIPIRPPVPVDLHRCTVVADALRGMRGYRATCSCAWSGPLETSAVTADLEGNRHVRRELERREAAR